MKQLRNITLSTLLLLTLSACAQSKQPATAAESAAKEPAAASEQRFGSEKVTLANGDITTINTFFEPGKLTLIDCWASWCQPCRRAIAHLKSLAQTYATQVNIVSISCDKDYDSWTRALAEEQMPWTQAILQGTQVDDFMGRYNIQYIPYLIVVQEGTVVLTTNHPNEVDAFLKTLQ